ncbi:MAG: NTP transferase domain-containing protein [Candidatus Eisenbacteria bacterium]|nr:NTP transferase domain-containing protein [Candidatus Latescibacterota bacterium]MBD3300991.1 NTP transferase domain-containing protein [Candidatus Eisenbacteria bacterium]
MSVASFSDPGGRTAPFPPVAFLLCGCLGTRLRAVTPRPKAVLDVAGWPFLRYHLEALRRGGIRRVVLLTGHGADEVERTFGPGREGRIFVPEPAPLGTGGALAAARAHAGPLNWVGNGDSFLDVPIEDLLRRHRPGTVGIAAVRTEDRSAYGGLEISGDDRITGFTEKGTRGPGWINAGVYLIERARLAALPEGVSSLERDHFPKWAATGLLVAHRFHALFRDIGTPERLAAAQEELRPIRARMERGGAGGAR